MAISGDYPHPVQVNGFECKNCTDVDNAKKHIDPARPKDGPYGVDAKDNPSKFSNTPAVTFGGQLARTDTGVASDNGTVANNNTPYQPGQSLNVYA